MKQYMLACILCHSVKHTLYDGLNEAITWWHALCHSANHTLYNGLNETIQWLHALCHSAARTLYEGLNETMHGCMYCVTQPIIHCMRD